MGMWEFSFGQDLSELQPHLAAITLLSMYRRFLTLAGAQQPVLHRLACSTDHWLSP
jgi:hypothetical protein